MAFLAWGRWGWALGLAIGILGGIAMSPFSEAVNSLEPSFTGGVGNFGLMLFGVVIVYLNALSAMHLTMFRWRYRAESDGTRVLVRYPDGAARRSLRGFGSGLAASGSALLAIVPLAIWQDGGAEAVLFLPFAAGLICIGAILWLCAHASDWPARAHAGGQVRVVEDVPAPGPRMTATSKPAANKPKGLPGVKTRRVAQKP